MDQIKAVEREKKRQAIFKEEARRRRYQSYIKTIMAHRCDIMLMFVTQEANAHHLDSFSDIIHTRHLDSFGFPPIRHFGCIPFDKAAADTC